MPSFLDPIERRIADQRPKRGGLRSVMAKLPGSRACPSMTWTSRVFFRPWTMYLSRAFVRCGVPANVVTLLSGLSLIAGAVMLVSASAKWTLIGAALVVLYHALDHCDGEVARDARAQSRRERSLGRDGQFWAGLVHGLEPVLIACLAIRLIQIGGLGWWPIAIAVVDVSAMCMAPWQRYCEMVVASIREAHRTSGGLPHEAMLESTTEPAATDGAQPGLSVLAIVRQLVLFPGYYVTLPIAAVLDVVVGPLVLRDGAILVPWLGLWLVLHALGNVVSVIVSSRRYAGRLQAIAVRSSSD